MKRILFLLSIGLAAVTPTLRSEPIMPTSDGTSWRYLMTEEAGEGLRFSNLPANENGGVQLPVIYRINGKEKVDGRDLLKFEMHRTGTVTNTDLLSVDDFRVVCFGRIDANGQLNKLDPPQIIVSPQLRDGESWDYDAEIGGAKVHQHHAVVEEEDVKVPAGTFDAFKIHTEQTTPNDMVEDRWFAKGVGTIKDVTTFRNEEGNLIKRVTLELQEPPKVAPRPEVSTKKLSGSVSGEAMGAAVTKFDADAPKIYARWQGAGLRRGAKVRVVWIAENIGEIAPPNYTIDEASATATAPDSHGLFTLSRPEDGWAPGDYRVEFYLDDALTDTVKLRIGK